MAFQTAYADIHISLASSAYSAMLFTGKNYAGIFNEVGILEKTRNFRKKVGILGKSRNFRKKSEF